MMQDVYQSQQIVLSKPLSHYTQDFNSINFVVKLARSQKNAWKIIVPRLICHAAAFLKLLILLPLALSAQSTETSLTKPLLLANDSFSVRFSAFPDLIHLALNEDTVDMGSDGEPYMYAVIYYGQDSLKVAYSNFPYTQVVYIPMQAIRRNGIYRLHFNGVRAWYDQTYRTKARGTVQVEIPEVYELANVIWSLSPSGRKAKNIVRSGSYFAKVAQHFKPYRQHPVFEKLDFPDSTLIDEYFDFRENSFAYSFDEKLLKRKGPYYYIMGNSVHDHRSRFSSLVPLIEDFAKKSRFKEFYNQNKPYYNRLVARQRQLLPVKEMWQWLEEEFPGIQYQSYKVVFSPLIGESHSTQNFITYSAATQEVFKESVMFVAGPEKVDQQDLTEKERESLMAGMVFTEIDHNYVNTTSYKWLELIDSVFGGRKQWTNQHAKWYRDAFSVFNEYMTHGLFCVWAKEYYDANTSAFVIREREKMMIERRGFLKFKEFNEALQSVRESNKNRKIADVYKELLLRCRSIIE